MVTVAEEASPYGGAEWCLWVNEPPDEVDRLRTRLHALALPYPVRIGGGHDLPTGAARNAAVRMARGDVVWMSDDDCIPVAGACTAHLAFHAKARSRAPNAVGVGRLALPQALRRGNVLEPFERVVHVTTRLTWMALTGANTSMARSTYQAVGGFEPSWREYGGDDHDFALRLKAGGATFHRVVGGTAHHHGRVWDDADKAYRAGRSHVAVARRHPRSGAAWWLGVHPLLAKAKHAWFTAPWAKALDATVVAYESAYAQGALDAWSDRSAVDLQAEARQDPGATSR